MRWLLDRYSVPELVSAVFVIAVVAILLYAAGTAGAAFAAFNPTWEGTSDLRMTAEDSGAETTVMEDAEEYDDLEADGTVVLIIGPSEGYTDDERDRIRGFVERGGTVLIADATDQHSGPVLETLGATTQIDGDPLRDERHYYRSPSLPVATETANHPYTNGVRSLTLNHGSTLEPGEATVIVQSSGFAYIDRNRNGTLDPDDEMGPHPVATVEEVDDGEVVVVSDSSVFTNVMLERPGNQAFATNLVAEHDRVVLDDSQTDETPPLVTATAAIQESSGLQMLVGAGLVLALAVLSRRPGVVGGVSDRLAGSPPEANQPPREPRSGTTDDRLGPADETRDR
jgi:hypothetical protein